MLKLFNILVSLLERPTEIMEPQLILILNLGREETIIKVFKLLVCSVEWLIEIMEPQLFLIFTTHVKQFQILRTVFMQSQSRNCLVGLWFDILEKK